MLTRDKASPAHLRGRRPPSLVSNSDTEESFKGKQADEAFVGQNQNKGHFENHPPMQSTENSLGAQHQTQHTAFTIDLGDEPPPPNLKSPQSNLESADEIVLTAAADDRSLDSPQQSLLEEAEAVIARLRPTSSPHQVRSSSSSSSWDAPLLPPTLLPPALLPLG